MPIFSHNFIFSSNNTETSFFTIINHLHNTNDFLIHLLFSYAFRSLYLIPFALIGNSNEKTHFETTSSNFVILESKSWISSDEKPVELILNNNDSHEDGGKFKGLIYSCFHYVIP